MAACNGRVIIPGRRWCLTNLVIGYVNLECKAKAPVDMNHFQPVVCNKIVMLEALVLAYEPIAI